MRLKLGRAHAGKQEEVDGTMPAAADEQDPKKLAALILQINYILEAKELRLTGGVPRPPTVEDRVANIVL
jgi:hypothetical protein